MEDQYQSRGGRGRRRGPRRSGGGRYDRDRGPRSPRTESPRKKKNPILAFFAKLFGGGKKNTPITPTRNYERGPRPDRPERSDRFKRPERPERQRQQGAETEAPLEPREPRISSATATALAEAKPEVTNEKLYIGNLSYDASESDLFDHFAKVGAVSNVEIVRDKSGRSKGFGFVIMNTLESAQEASEKYHRTDFLGRQIVVAGSKK
jgi:hypothetical protein